MKVLEKPYTRLQLNQFIDECNARGDVRVERHNGNAYALFEYEAVIDGEIVDLSDTEEYKTRKAAEHKIIRTEEINRELEELDKKRVRALCEPETVREDGSSWLDYYNQKIQDLRDELNSL